MTTYFSQPRAEHLVDILDWVGSEYASREVHFPAQRQSETYRSLADKSAAAAGGLLRHGVKPGQVVGILFSSCPEFIISYFGVLRAHAAVAPLPGVVSMGGLGIYLARLQAIVESSGIEHIILEDAFAPWVANSELGARVKILSLRDLLSTAAAPPEGAISPDALAMVQYTSGSMAVPKSVPLSHRNIVAGLRAISLGIQLGPDDVNGQWLPLFHDMGLIGMLAGISCGVTQYIWPPSSFIKNPARFLKEFARRRATIYAGPNFSYAYLQSNVRPSDLADVDLSAWRIAFNGAEPIDVRCLQAFIDYFRPAGFKPQTMFPVYGLAEATLAVSFPALGSKPYFERVDKHALANERKAVEVAPEHPSARGVVAVGSAVHGLEIAIAAPDTADLSICEERNVGEVLVRGESMMAGYHNHDNAEYFRDGWFRTGDLGYLSNGRLFITGRIKQMIIVNGVNYYPEDVEAALRHEDGVYHQHLVAFEMSEDGQENIGVVVESTAKGQEAHALAARLHQRLVASFGVSCFVMYIVSKRAIRRTTSGKFQRILMRDLILSSAITDKIVCQFPAPDIALQERMAF